MTQHFPSIFFSLLLFLGWTNSQAQELSLDHIATYRTGAFDQGAAEISSYDKDTKRLFFVNSSAASVDILDIADPNNPTLVSSIDCSTFGASANSVSVHNGLVAVAIQNDNRQADGSIVFFDTDGNFLNEVNAGPLPDMLTFNPDGSKIICANEGEPDDDYLVDPEGSVTIVDLAGGVMNPEVTKIPFTGFNDKKMHLLNKGVRIFGNDGQSSVAQDLEPEYITLSADGAYAYVACQENNAIAVVDVNAKAIIDILPLGYKDHNKGAPKLKEQLLNEIPWWGVFDLGTPKYDNQSISLGGFSGLYYDPMTSTPSQWSFWAVPDRGPTESAIDKANAGSLTDLRPFKLPDYQARLVKLNYIPSLDMVFPDANQIYLRQADNTPITGRANIPGLDETPVTPTDATSYPNADYSVNGVDYQALEFDPFGGNFGGVLRTPDFHFWLCDKYRPGIYHFDAHGVLVDRFVPEGTAQLGTTPQTPGFYGSETLPAVYNSRRANRGFEAIAYDSDEDIIYAFVQSPIENPGSAEVRDQSDVIRILGIDRNSGQAVKEFVYLLERNRDAGVGLSRVDKIGDAVYAGNGKFYVIERDASMPNDGNTGRKYIYEIRLDGATNILGTALAMKMTSSGPNDKTLEMMTAGELAAADIRPVHKTKSLNLPSINYLPNDKPEGLALLPNGDLAVLNDNDYGLAGAGVSDESSLGFIQFQRNYGFDASDRNDDITIEPRPTLGIFQPDAIASYEVNGKQYLVSANEGDSRDYDGYSEEDRVKDLVLDPVAFPNADELLEDENLGRLKITLANGDIDQDGMTEIIYSYGARSFSIWDEFGNLVFDSGDEFEQQLALLDPDNFNSNNDDNDSYKRRSDDKGTEPEAVAIVERNGATYALIGLERMGGIFVYNISNPYEPYFVNYTNNRNFEVDAESDAAGDLGVENIIFINAEDSPNGEALVVTANEISGTISFFGLSGTPTTRPAADTRSDARMAQQIYQDGAHPNPFRDQINLNYHLEEEGRVEVLVFNSLGQKTMVLANEFQGQGYHQISLNTNEHLVNGNYWMVLRKDGEIFKTFSVVKK